MEFLSDPDKIRFVTKCISCKEDLWRTRILKRSGNKVVSTEVLPVGNNKEKFTRQLEKCPLCKDDFYMPSKDGGRYLIRDENSGITRIV